jgi:hypothetical protein
VTAIESQHSRVFRELVNKFRATLVNDLANGTPPDYPAYRQAVGRIEGLSDALKLSEESDFTINGGDN